jgi:ribonuclease P/MRP protein subunit RPP1
VNGDDPTDGLVHGLTTDSISFVLFVISLQSELAIVKRTPIQGRRMYETVHARPDGTSTVARFALTASEQGYDGLVVRNHGDEMAQYDPDHLSSEFDIDVIDAVEVRADDRSRAAGFITSHRSRRTIVCVHGGRLNRLACEDERVDVLAHPMIDGDFNHVLARAAADNAVRVEFNLARVLREDGGIRVQSLRGHRKLRELIEKYDVPYVVSADATSHLHLRAPRELIAVGKTIGFTGEQIREGLREWGRLASRNRDRKSESFIEPGVRKGKYEKDG